MSGPRYPIGTCVYWLHEKTRQAATVMGQGRDVSVVYTEIQLEDGATRRVPRSQLKKARLGTATDAVLKILSVLRDFPWLTMRDIMVLGGDRDLGLNAVASALADLEAGGHVTVCRDRRPYRYRGCP